MNVNSIKINNVMLDCEVDLDKELPSAVEGLEVVEGLVSSVSEHGEKIGDIEDEIEDIETDVTANENAITGLIDNENLLGAKNMIPLKLATLKSLNITGTWVDNVYSLNGVDFTVNTDSLGSVTDITVNGTATGNNSQLVLSLQRTSEVTGKILNGAGVGTGRDTVCIFGTYLVNEGGGWAGEIRQYDGVDVTISEIESARYFRPAILVLEDYTATNVKFYPMIRLATDTDATYRPYAMGNQELTQRLLSLEARVTALEG